MDQNDTVTHCMSFRKGHSPFEGSMAKKNET